MKRNRVPAVVFVGCMALMAASNAFAWTLHNGHYYRMTDDLMTWTEARDYAVKLGGYLVTVDDVLENDWIHT
ncbi:MAG: Lectin C-type domain, partial [Candidatus Hydrogenedentes bacterium]|nr:Lectin C-type domain [Candidatus Hydrogenedentota bacterium]